jgi:chorismate mutase
MSSERFDELRRLIAENDHAIVAGVNERLRLVAELWELKRERGEPTLDPEREQALRAALASGSDGPLSAEGVDRLATALLDLTKAELGGMPPAPASG